MANEEIKNDIKTFTKGLIPKRPKYRADYQMTLGSLIKALVKERTGLPVYIDFPAITFGYPGKPHSYYGYHSDLAFEPTMEPITVAEFLEVCTACISKSFLAPDGSPGFYRDYTMKINTPLWISKLDTASTLGITDVISTVDSITLKTTEIKEEPSD